MLKTADEVIQFWVDAGPTRWFQGGPEFDAHCREQCLTLHFMAARGGLHDWCETAEGALALILLLDQIPRNVFRKSAHAYATDPMALAIARQAVSRGQDRNFDLPLRSFFYLPYMHSESLADQHACVALYEQIPESHSGQWAVHHRDIIQRFGRFPHRNHLLGRDSTPEEEQWLAEGGFSG